jgi:outer membrane receptor protein involved in Fe transport
MSLPRLTLLAAALQTLSIFNAGAQTTVAPPPPATAPVQKVEITGNQEKYDARRDDTATKIVVTQEEIIKQGDTTLADVLKRQPGITVSGGSPGRGGGEVRMRGLGAGYTQILLNGDPAPPGFALDSLSPDLVERIEIVRAATAEFSTQAIAGTINIVLKKSVKVAQREFKLNVAGSSTFVAPNFSYQLSDKVGALSYSFTLNGGAGKFDQDSYQIDDGTDARGAANLLRRSPRNENGHFRGFQLTPRLNYTFENGDTLTSQSFADINAFNRVGSNAWTASLGDVPPIASGSNAFTGTREVFRSDLNWVHKFEGGAKLDTKFGLNSQHRSNRFAEIGSNARGTLALDSTTDSDTDDHGATLTGKYSTPIVEDHTLAAGWDGATSQRSDNRLQHDKPIPGFVPVNLDEGYDATVRRLALFAQDEWSVTPKWSVYFGLRWEGLQTTSEGNAYSAITNRSSVISPLFQTLWKLPDTNNDQIRFALTRTYKAPSTDRLIPRRFTQTNNSATTPDEQGNPNLRPELAWGLDGAYEHYFGTGGAMMSVSAYMRRIDDFNRRGLSQIGGRWIAMPVNDGRANTHGLELEAKFPLQLFWKEGPAIDVRANLNRNWSTVEDVPGPDNRLADQTPLSINLGLDYRLNADFNVGGTFTYKSGGPIRISETQSTYATIKRELDVYALWKFDAKTQLRISAVNVLAQDFTFIQRYADANGSLRNTSVFPVTALLRGALEMKF